MSGIEELEREAAALSAMVHAPTEQERAAMRLAEVRDRIAAAQEARSSAEAWLLGNVRAIGGAESELAKTLDRIRENPNQKDVERANGIWDKIRERLAWAFLVERRLPGVKVPHATAPVAPGFRCPGVTGLSVEGVRRPIHPTIVAWWSLEVRERAWEAAAAEWITANGSRLPEDLRAVLQAAPPASFVEPATPRGPSAAEVEANMRRAVATGRARTAER